MQTAQIAIVGGGLSGLYAAFLLEQKGIKDYVLLEARDTLGGRIPSLSSLAYPHLDPMISTGSIDCFDLGPTWFWPVLQPQLDRPVRDLDLERFEQHETGDMVVERSPNEPPWTAGRNA